MPRTPKPRGPGRPSISGRGPSDSRLVIRLTSELAAKLQSAAADSGRPQAEIVRLAIADYLEGPL
jgi:hypothetical protein